MTETMLKVEEDASPWEMPTGWPDLPEQSNPQNRWTEVEECLDSIVMDVQHRCYPEPGTSGVRHLLMVVRRHLLQIDQLLLEEANDSTV